MQMAGVDAGESKVFATLGAATNLLVDLEAVDTEVRSNETDKGKNRRGAASEGRERARAAFSPEGCMWVAARGTRVAAEGMHVAA